MTSKTLIIFNPESGPSNRQKSLQRAFKSLVKDGKIVVLGKKARISKIIAKAEKDGYATVVAAGGDGTVSSVVSTIVKHNINVKFGVIPLGTLNHFARDIGIPRSLYRAVDIIARGKSTYVDVGCFNSYYFLNNASLGIYPYIVSERDSVKTKGWRKWMRLAWATGKALKRYPYVNVQFESKGKIFERHTPLVFIGNNRYNLRLGTESTARRGLTEATLSVFLAHHVSRMRLVSLALSAFQGTLSAQHDFDQVGLSKLTIKSKRKKLKISHDGEVSLVRTPVRFSIKPRALRVIIP